MRLIEIDNPGFHYELGLLDDAVRDISQAPEAWSASVKPSVQQAYAGIEVAREAVNALKAVETPEQYIEALAIAKAAIDELAKAQNMANAAAVKADTTASAILPAVEGIESPLDIVGAVKRAVSAVKSGVSKVATAVTSAASKVVNAVKAVPSAVVNAAKTVATGVKNFFTGSGQRKATAAAQTGKATGQAKAPITPAQKATMAQSPQKTQRQITALQKQAAAQVKEVVKPAFEQPPHLLVPEELIGAIGQVEPEKLPVSISLLRVILSPLKGLVQKFDELKATRNETKAALDRARAAMPQIKDPDWLTRYKAAEAAFATNQKKYSFVVKKIQGWVDWYKKVTKTEGEVSEVASPAVWMISVPVVIAAITGLSLLIGGLIGAFLTLKSQIPEAPRITPVPVYIPPAQTPPSGATPIPGQPGYYYLPTAAPEEKPLLEKFLGIKGNALVAAGAAIILIWGASKILPSLLAKAKE